MSDFTLSASLEGHEDDVRGVAFPTRNTILSASRDATVRLWKLLSSSPPTYDQTVTSHGSAFINTLAYFPPTSEYPEGLVISGGKDTIIDVRQPSRASGENADALLLGHSNNICSLDVQPKGGWIVSGGWDGEARIWKVGRWECDAVLEGHGGSVWAVLAYDRETVITGCADKIIRIFNTSGKALRAIKGVPDVVRALCLVPPSHPSGAEFASASNDGVIRLWTMKGAQVGELYGHESFIYSLAVLPTGELVSSGEDRTVRIWRGSECVQTITHPAISVWSVAVCNDSGDIVSGASDRVVRVFTREKERYAASESIAAFEESVKNSSIPQQQVGDINKEKLPGPEFLTQKSGTKEGQVVMIRETNGSITAHQWSQAAQQWLSVGTVVDSVGSSGRKQEFQGKDFDYVFDVDIEDGKPPLKLPYNLSQNPYEAAAKFLQDNELPASYLDQVANFIVQNTQGANLGSSFQPNTGPDPLGTESRYRPGDGTAATPQPVQRPKVLPQTTYLSIRSANLKTIHKKIEELNNKLISEGDKEHSLNPADLSALASLMKVLDANPSPGSSPVISDGLAIIMKMIASWPPAQKLPALDLLRLLAAASPITGQVLPGGKTIVEALDSSNIFRDLDRSNNIMLAVRSFANLFETEAGRILMDAKFKEVHSLVKSSSANSDNRNLTIAVATLYINYAVLVTSTSSPQISTSVSRAKILLGELIPIISGSPDSEATYRSLVAVGTLLTIGEDLKERSRKDEIQTAIMKAERRIKEPRIKGVVEEIKSII